MRNATGRIVSMFALFVLAAGAVGRVEGAFLVSPTQTYYDGSDGSLATPIALPGGATFLQFTVTGWVRTAGTGSRQLSPDGLGSDGTPDYNFTGTSFSSRYQGVSVGGTTGTDPALFGIFFSPNFTGTAPNSPNFRSDATPDLRISSTYSPLLNQPFFIGDGLTGNNGFGNNATGSVQTFYIPTGATELLLGLGADPVLSDNFGPGYTVNISSDANPVPEPSSMIMAASATLIGVVIYRGRKSGTG